MSGTKSAASRPCLGSERKGPTVAQTINEAQENGDLRVGTDQQIVVANETNEAVDEAHRERTKERNGSAFSARNGA